MLFSSTLFCLVFYLCCLCSLNNAAELNDTLFLEIVKQNKSSVVNVNEGDFNNFIGLWTTKDNRRRTCNYGLDLQDQRTCYASMKTARKFSGTNRVFPLWNFDGESGYKYWFAQNRHSRFELIVFGSSSIIKTNISLDYVPIRSFVHKKNLLILSETKHHAINYCGTCKEKITVSVYKENGNTFSPKELEQIKKCFTSSMFCVEDIETKTIVFVPGDRRRLIYHRYEMTVYSICCDSSSGPNCEYDNVGSTGAYGPGRCVQFVYDHKTNTDYVLPDSLFNRNDGSYKGFFFPVFGPDDKLLKSRVPDKPVYIDEKSRTNIIQCEIGVFVWGLTFLLF